MEVWTKGIAAVMNCSFAKADRLRLAIENEFSFQWDQVTGSQVKRMCNEVMSKGFK